MSEKSKRYRMGVPIIGEPTMYDIDDLFTMLISSNINSDWTTNNLMNFICDTYNANSLIDIYDATVLIKEHIMGYIKAGVLADRVRKFRLYENFTTGFEKCASFSAYCRRYLGKSEWYVNKIINAAKVALKLITMGFPVTQLPDNECQARPLVKVYQKAVEETLKFKQSFKDFLTPEGKIEPPPNPDELLKNKWQKVLTTVPPGHVTGDKISEIVEDNPQPPAKQKVHVRSATREKWERLAREAGMTPDDYLEALLNKTLDNNTSAEVQEPTAEQEQAWLEDVSNLVEEHDSRERSSTATVETNSPDDGERIVNNDDGNRNFSRNVSKTNKPTARRRRRP